MNQARQLAELMRDADVHHPHFRAHVRREDVHARAAAQEVPDHLRGDGARIGAPPFGDDAVIRREREDCSAWTRWSLLAGDRDIAGGQFFQAPETPDRFRQPVKPSLCPAQAVLIDRVNGVDRVLQCHPCSFGFRRSGRPDITTYTSSAAFANCWLT